MFSEILHEMDRNTIRYMVDDMNEQIEKGKVVLAESKKSLDEKDAELARLKALLEGK